MSHKQREHSCLEEKVSEDDDGCPLLVHSMMFDDDKFYVVHKILSEDLDNEEMLDSYRVMSVEAILEISTAMNECAKAKYLQ